DRWITLAVQMTGSGLAVRVDGRLVVEYDDRDHPLPAGTVGLRTWRREASFRGLTIGSEAVPFRAVDPHGPGGVSGMWQVVRSGSANGAFALEAERPFVGTQSQRITFQRGQGSVGVANRGLNRWGLSFVAGKPYEGYLWMRVDEPAEVHVAAESRDGK